jgi:hypothetical protein
MDGCVTKLSRDDVDVTTVDFKPVGIFNMWDDDSWFHGNLKLIINQMKEFTYFD